MYEILSLVETWRSVAYVCMYVYIYIYICLCVCVFYYSFIYLNMCLFVYLFIYLLCTKFVSGCNSWRSVAYVRMYIYGPVLRLSNPLPPNGLDPHVAAPIPFYLQAIGSISEVQLRIC